MDLTTTVPIEPELTFLLLVAVQTEWGPPRRPLWDGTDYIRTQRSAAGTGGLTALVRCSFARQMLPSLPEPRGALSLNPWC